MIDPRESLTSEVHHLISRCRIMALTVLLFELIEDVCFIGKDFDDHIYPCTCRYSLMACRVRSCQTESAERRKDGGGELNSLEYQSTLSISPNQ
jgi:hypothetical protein